MKLPALFTVLAFDLAISTPGARLKHADLHDLLAAESPVVFLDAFHVAELGQYLLATGRCGAPAQDLLGQDHDGVRTNTGGLLIRCGAQAFNLRVIDEHMAQPMGQTGHERRLRPHLNIVALAVEVLRKALGLLGDVITEHNRLGKHPPRHVVHRFAVGRKQGR